MKSLKRWLAKMMPAGVMRLMGKSKQKPVEAGVLQGPVEAPASIADYHLERLGAKTPEAKANLSTFTKRVFEMESSSNPQALNKITSAAGGFQFVKDSVLPAITRIERASGSLPPWAKALKNIYDRGLSKDQHRKLMTDLPLEQQAELFLGDIMEKTIDKTPGLGDNLMKGILSGDTDAMKELYFRGHHTEPDEATRERAMEVFK